MRLRGRCLPLCLLFFMFIVLHGFYTNLQNRVESYLRRHVHYNPLSAAQCAAIKGIILRKSLKRIKPHTFRRYMSDLQRCPWTYNQSEHDLLRMKFGRCCNASRSFIVTRQNAPLGHQLKYETNPKTVTVNEKLHEMLPKTSPFTVKPFDSCAVVGNGGILLDSFCGSEIDKTDYVIRFNLPPLTRGDDVGTKTDVVTANPSILIDKFGKLHQRRKPFIDLVRGYGSAMVVLPAFSYVFNTDISFRALYSIQDFDLLNQVVFFHPEYLRNLSIYWKEEGLRAKRLSSGLMLVSAAIELCSRVTLYGFWPFSQSPDGTLLPHHYYNDMKPKPGFHAMPEEFYFYAQMHLKGVLHLKVGQCY